MTTTTTLSEFGVTVPDGKSVAMVIACSHSYCGCLYVFFNLLGETELRCEETWRTRADARYLPPAGRSSGRLLERLKQLYPGAMVLKSMKCYGTDTPDVFETNACSYCVSLANHDHRCPMAGRLPYDMISPASRAARAWYYGYRMGHEGRWDGFIARVYANSPLVQLGYTRGKRDLEREGPLNC